MGYVDNQRRLASRRTADDVERGRRTGRALESGLNRRLRRQDFEGRL